MNVQIPARTIVTATRRARTVQATSLVPAMLVTTAMEQHAQTWMNVQIPARTIVTPTRRARTLQAASLVPAKLVTTAMEKHAKTKQ